MIFRPLARVFGLTGDAGCRDGLVRTIDPRDNDTYESQSVVWPRNGFGNGRNMMLRIVFECSDEWREKHTYLFCPATRSLGRHRVTGFTGKVVNSLFLL